MPSIAWTKEFKGTGRRVLFGSDFVLLQLGPDDRWRHEGNYSFLDGEKGSLRCAASLSTGSLFGSVRTPASLPSCLVTAFSSPSLTKSLSSSPATVTS